MVYVVKETLDVYIQNPSVLPAPLPCFAYGIQCGFIWPVPIGISMEMRLDLRLQIHLADHLRNSVRHGGNPERSGSLAFPFLGNLDPLNGWREVTPRRHPIPELVQIVL